MGKIRHKKISFFIYYFVFSRLFGVKYSVKVGKFSNDRNLGSYHRNFTSINFLIGGGKNIVRVSLWEWRTAKKKWFWNSTF